MSDCGSGDEKKPSPSENTGAAGGGAGGFKAGADADGAGAAGGVAAGASAAARKDGKDRGGATRKSTREVVKTEKAKPATWAKYQEAGEGGAVGGGGGGVETNNKRKHADVGNVDAADGDGEEGEEAEAEFQEVELEANGKPKLPRPTVPVSCPRCDSEETKFCYYNNYNIKQPRYFCRVSFFFRCSFANFVFRPLSLPNPKNASSPHLASRWGVT